MYISWQFDSSWTWMMHADSLVGGTHIRKWLSEMIFINLCVYSNIIMMIILCVIPIRVMGERIKKSDIIPSKWLNVEIQQCRLDLQCFTHFWHNIYDKNSLKYTQTVHVVNRKLVRQKKATKLCVFSSSASKKVPPENEYYNYLGKSDVTPHIKTVFYSTITWFMRQFITSL